MKSKIFIKISLLFFTLLNLNFMEEATAQNGKEQNNTTKITVPDTLTTTQKSIKVNGKALNYTAKTGYITLKTESGEAQGHIFFTAYTKDGVKDTKTRPITFAFNGGPGSAAVWLHMGVLGPRRVLMTDEGASLKPPYEIVDNEYTWLEETDLVFIDPITTGFSRPNEEKDGKKFHGFLGDIQSVADFIRRYTTENERWASPKYLIGESYGTTRASALSKELIDSYGFYLNGIILMSSVLDFQTILYTPQNDLPYSLYLPSYAATAHYHKKLDRALQEKPIKDFLKEVEDFTINEYNTALFKGNLLKPQEKEKIAKKLSYYTGVSKDFYLRSNLRINLYRYNKELLRSEYEVLGRFDSRYKYIDTDGNRESGELDPSFQPAILGPFGTAINHYLRSELGFKTDLPYNLLTGKVHPWDYSTFNNKYVNTAEYLRKAMIMNPHMKVWVASGFYDLATPYFATEYTMHHLGLPEHLEKNIHTTYYEAGHMMYLHKPSLIQLKNEVKDFYKTEEK